MKKRIYLHIGLHKTGSTSIQIALARQLAQLRSKSYDLPSIQEGYPYHHTLVENWVRLGERFRTGLDSATSWKLLLESFERSNCCAAIVSSEEFSNVAITDERIAQFATTLEDYDVKVILYLRRQDSFIESAYKEVKKHVNWPSFDHYWKEAVADSLRLDYPALVSLWERHFGVSSVRLFDYHRISTEGRNLVETFLELCDLPASSFTLSHLDNANVSDSNLGIALKDHFQLNHLADADKRIASMIPLIEYHLYTNNMKASFISQTLRQEIVEQWISRNASLNLEMTDHLRGKDAVRHVTVEELLSVPGLRNQIIKNLLVATPSSLSDAA